jgi:hypothetical protein
MGDPKDEIEEVPEPVGMEPELERLDELEGDDERVETENGIV